MLTSSLSGRDLRIHGRSHAITDLEEELFAHHRGTALLNW